MIAWYPESADGGRHPCPNCGAAPPLAPILTAPVGQGRTTLWACPRCGAHSFQGDAQTDYAAAPPGGGDALAFYLQQGANIGEMAMRLMRLGLPAGTDYLEVGCGFGLSLDFARRVLGWRVRGLDPSPFAAAGRAQLDLPIESRFLMSGGLDAASADVIHASEFIEHVADPVAMLRTMASALRPGGTLLLTTPAAEMIRPDTPPGLLTPLLSIGWHLVIHTEASLAWALREAGFPAAQIYREGAQLIAIAGPGAAAPANRARYVRWLGDVAVAVPGSDLELGMLVRQARELVIAGDSGGKAALAAFEAACLRRYGVDLAGLAALPLEPLPLSRLAAREPLCLAGALMARGWLAARAGEDARVWWCGVGAAAGRLRQALAAIGSDDGDAEDLAAAAEAELILLDLPQADVAARLSGLTQAYGPRHAERIAPTCFVRCVNLGRFDQAGRLWHVVTAALAGAGEAEQRASVLFCAAAFRLQTKGGDAAEALEWLQRLRREIADGEAPAHLIGPVFEAMVLAHRLLGDDLAAAKVQQEAARIGPPA
jgi:SAM-dependent methyltransferase